jgi:hypothetical protein
VTDAGNNTHWQPISKLPLFSDVIGGMLADGEEHYQTLLGVRATPYVLDDILIKREFDVFSVQKGNLRLFEEQLTRWKRESLTAGQRQEVEELSDALVRLRAVLDSILSLASELSRGTIDKVLAKSDFKVGVEALLRMHTEGGVR